MPEKKTRLVKNYRRLLKKKNTSESGFNQLEHKLSKDVHETEEGLGIEEEEETVEESYLGMEEELVHEDNPEKEDE